MSDRATERVYVEDGGRSWSPARILALVVGLIFVVLGGVALVRAGIGIDNIFEPTTNVAGLAYTPLLAIIELAFGLMLLALGAFPAASDGIVFLGLLALAFGLLLVIEPAALQGSIAAGRAHGWFYVVTGGMVALTGLAAPAVGRRSGATRIEERRVEDRQEPTPKRGDDDETQRLDASDRETSRQG